MKKILFTLFVVLPVLVSCQKESVYQFSDGEMQFVCSLPGSTKATATNFEQGDKVGLFATLYNGADPLPLQVSGNWANNDALSYTNSQWIASRKIMWSEDSKMDVYAYYPYLDTIDSIDEQFFSVSTDQSIEKSGEDLGGYEKSDLLWAKVTGIQKISATPDPVNLAFSHCCSKLVVKLAKGSGFQGTFPEDAQLRIHNTVPEGVINFTTGSVSKYLYGNTAVIRCHKVANPDNDGCPVYEAIIIPQRVDSKRPFIEYYTGKTSYLVEDTFNFKPGYCYTYTLTINASPEQTIISIGGTIEGWN